jgi:putative tricarboxylic transport membrane protein
VKVNDAVVGTALIALAIAILVHIQAYPLIPGQKYGAALFPGAIAVGFLITGALLVARGVRQGGPLFAPGAWLRSPRLATNFLAICAVLVFYIVEVDALGFVLTGSACLVALFVKFGVRPARAVVIAVVATLVIHFLFFKLLRVPLPWGVLERFAW